MITESVVCVILHCSRCNIAFREDHFDDGTCHWDSTDDVTAAFKKGLGEYGGWRKFGDRFVCSNCQITTGFADDQNAREKPEPLPAAEADKVTRAQTSYPTFESVQQLQRGGKELGRLVDKLVEVMRVTVIQGSDKPVAALREMACWLDGADALTAEEVEQVHAAFDAMERVS